MKSSRLLLLLLIPLVLAGCATLGSHDLAVLRAHNVPPYLYQKMTNGDPLTISDVIMLSDRSVPSGLIIHYMDETDTAYRLRKADVQQLRSAGVSDEVISYMLSTSAPPDYHPAYPPPPYAYPYPYAYYPYDYYGPYGGPVVVVGGYRGGGGWGYRRW